MTNTSIQLDQLPAPQVIEALSFEQIVAEAKEDLIARFPDAADALTLESEPLTKLLEAHAYRELLVRARYNDEARSLLLAFAVGSDLDHIGATYYQEARLLITPGNVDAVPPTFDAFELDDNYRRRLILKPASYSVAGPTDAYLFHALSAHPDVMDASITSPRPGTTTVTVLSRVGLGIPTQAVLDAVSVALNAESIRPLSEEVIIESAQIVQYAIDITIYTYDGPDQSLVLANALAKVNEYKNLHRRLGNDITLSGLIAAAHQPGVQNTVVISPSGDVVCSAAQLAYCTSVNLAVAGVGD